MDAIVLLKTDHKEVARLFREADRYGKPKELRKVADTILAKLTVHATIEEEIFYPTAKREVDDSVDLVLESEEEHHVIKALIAELGDMNVEHEHFWAKLTVLKEIVEHHVKEEEEEFFPKVRKALGRTRLTEIGAELERAKKREVANAR